jgi:multidrug transporter EmrE-like cation transporter
MQRYFWALIAALVLNATANLLIKASAGGAPGGGAVLAGGAVGAIKGLLTNWLFLVGLVCFGLNLVAYQFALQKMQISIAYPIMVTCGYVIIVVVASLKMGERLVPVQWVGVGLILLGVWLVSASVKANPRATGQAGPAALQDGGPAAR